MEIYMAILCVFYLAQEGVVLVIRGSQTNHQSHCFECNLTHWGRNKMKVISLTTFFRCIFLKENVWILIKIPLKFVPKDPFNKIPALVKIMACRCSDNKPLSEPMMVSLPMQICVTRPQWVKWPDEQWCLKQSGSHQTCSRFYSVLFCCG